MMALGMAKKSLVVVNFLSFVALLAFNGLSNIKSPLFPRSIGNVSNEFPTQITPTGATFAIWGFIYLFQAAWIVYSLTLTCRSNAADILPAKFYVFYMFSTVCNVCWLLVWVREELNLSLAFLVATVISLALSVYEASAGLQDYLKQFPSSTAKPNNADIWCVRILVQNGIIFYTAWVTLATCINFVVTLHYAHGLDDDKVTTAVLAFLLCLIVFWFVMENFVVKEYTRFIFAEYIVFIVGLSGVIKAHWTGGQGNQAFVLVNLVVSAGFLVARLALIIVQEKKTTKTV